VADFNGGTVDGRKPDDAVFPEISQLGIGLSPGVPVPHAVDFRGKIVPDTRGSVARKNEHGLAIAKIGWPILLLMCVASAITQAASKIRSKIPS
jgi:hypothetical protein